jgi:LysR family nitrogen assimilation transcriptional regulator
MDFKRLNYFLKIAELGSVSRAADRLRVAQPALSRQMMLLEAELGVTLFERHRRGMALTREGEELRTRTSGPMRQIDLAAEDIRTLGVGMAGNVACGLPPTASHVLAAPLARRVAQEAPNLALRIVEGYAGHLMDWLQRGEIDIAILYGPACDFRLSASELLVEELMLVGPPECGLQPDEPVAFGALAQLPMILPSHPHGLRVVVDNMVARTQAKLDIRFQADSFTLMKELVETGLGYTILPLPSFQREAHAGKLRYAPITNPRLTRQLMLAMQPSIAHSQATYRLAKMIRQEVADLVTSGRWSATLLFDPATIDR